MLHYLQRISRETLNTLLLPCSVTSTATCPAIASETITPSIGAGHPGSGCRPLIIATFAAHIATNRSVFAGGYRSCNVASIDSSIARPAVGCAWAGKLVEASADILPLRVLPLPAEGWGPVRRRARERGRRLARWCRAEKSTGMPRDDVG